jgi:hypothetical protein
MRKATPRSKLTAHDVAQIRELIEWKKEELARINSIASMQSLADKFGVSVVTIHKISSYRTW